MARPNGVNEVLIMATLHHMIISNGDHIILIIHSMHLRHMEIMPNTWLQEATLALVGSKGLTRAYRVHPHTVALMTIMEDKVIYQMLSHQINMLVQCPHTVLVLHLYLPWAHPLPRPITTMDNHKAQIMVIRCRILNQGTLNKVMDMDLIIVLPPNVLMVDM